MTAFINVQTPRLMFFTVHPAWILQPPKKANFLVLIKMAQRSLFWPQDPEAAAQDHIPNWFSPPGRESL